MENNIGHDYINRSADLRIKFFFHWSLLSGATLGLIFPLLASLKASGVLFFCVEKLKFGIIFLLISLVLSSVRNFIAAQGYWYSGVFNLNSQNKVPQDSKKFISKMKLVSLTQKIIEGISVFGYILGLVLVYLFFWPHLGID